jgi:hypothetical protein
VDIARSVTSLGFGATVMEDEEAAGTIEITIKVSIIETAQKLSLVVL